MSVRPAKINQRDVQKEETAAHFRETARRLFYEKGYHAASVEQIVASAGTSRATFYLYFRSKRDVLMSILKSDLAAQMEVYRALGDMEELSWRNVRAWLDDYRRQMDRCQASLPLFSFAFEGEPERNPVSIDHRDEAIRHIGLRFAAFDLTHGDPAVLARRRARAFAFLLALEQVAMVFSTGGNTPEIDVGLDLMADDLFLLLSEGERHRSRVAGG